MQNFSVPENGLLFYRCGNGKCVNLVILSRSIISRLIRQEMANDSWYTIVYTLIGSLTRFSVVSGGKDSLK